MTSIRSKKAFTLIEMIIVVIIMFTVYYLVFTNNSFGIKEEKKEINLLNLREFLLSNFIFKKELSFICIEDSFSCFIKIDGELNKDFKIDNFFKAKPKVYEYSKYLIEKNFYNLRIDNFTYDVIFEFRIDDDYKTNDFILDTLISNVYVFNSIFSKPIEYKTIEDILDDFEKKQNEVRDAF
ncbi:prepilin-type N-terminal cleavage/methylation domain-containing protein [Aliarcobacter cryaerophilus]|uniref:prepilin-type N-terminal cleavage/methylation domain-containing protein n=1 Tax=Aliarcobacter cryaerophilus TaxID=28198 RepID=UPI003DA3AEC9